MTDRCEKTEPAERRVLPRDNARFLFLRNNGETKLPQGCSGEMDVTSSILLIKREKKQAELAS
jgi:hypothetical protein